MMANACLGDDATASKARATPSGADLDGWSVLPLLGNESGTGQWLFVSTPSAVVISRGPVADGRALGWDWSRVNVRGGAVALGHPIGASGARVLTTLLYAMRDRKVPTGLATLCLGGGNAVALSVEAM